MKDGGAAFPVYEEGRYGETGEFSSGMECTEQGMTLRDYFAGQALTQTIKIAWDWHEDGGIEYEDIHKDAADMAYKLADAMIARREEVKEEKTDE